MVVGGIGVGSGLDKSFAQVGLPSGAFLDTAGGLDAATSMADVGWDCAETPHDRSKLQLR